MASDLVRAPKRAKSEKRSKSSLPAKLTMTPARIRESLSTMRWLHELPARPSDGEIDVLRVEIVNEWMGYLMLSRRDVSSIHVVIPTRREIREALAEHRTRTVIDFATAAARVRSQRAEAARAL